MLKGFNFKVTLTKSYTVDVPDGMDPDTVARELAYSFDFWREWLRYDLDDADLYDIESDTDDFTGEVDITKDDVLGWIGED